MKKTGPLHNDLKVIGQAIRQLRTKQGYTQESFAAEVEIDRGYYGCLERGEHNFSLAYLLRITRKLNIEVWELFKKIRTLK